MITIFCNPRPFKGFYKITQTNTIKNWKSVLPDAQIILLEDEEGTTRSIAKKFNTDYIGNLKKNKYGTPLLNDVFEKVAKMARFDTIAQVNIDILLFPDFLRTISRLKKLLPEFFMVGQRWDLDIDEALNFGKGWERKLKDMVKKNGAFHPATGSDYWVFSKGVNRSIPPFIVGRPAADGWFISDSLRKNIPVIDTTETVMIVHQNHPRNDSDQIYIKEKKINAKVYKDSTSTTNKGMRYCTLFDATHVFTETGLAKKKYSPWEYILKQIIYSRYYPELIKINKGFWMVIHRLLSPILNWYYRLEK